RSYAKVSREGQRPKRVLLNVYGSCRERNCPAVKPECQWDIACTYHFRRFSTCPEIALLTEVEPLYQSLSFVGVEIQVHVNMIPIGVPLPKKKLIWKYPARFSPGSNA